MARRESATQAPVVLYGDAFQSDAGVVATAAFHLLILVPILPPLGCDREKCLNRILQVPCRHGHR